MNNKKILVTGGTGLIGVPLVNKLIALGATVTVASLDSAERAEAVLPDGVEFIRADLTDMSVCNTVVTHKDYVFHLAGIKGSVNLGRSRAASFFVPHLLFNTNMMEAAYKAGVEKYLYTSSIGVYPEANIFKEDDAWSGPPFSVDVFPGWAKRIGELQAEAYYLEYGWDKISIVRPANVYGPYDNFDPDTAMVIGALVHKFANHKEGKINIWGDGTQIRDFIYSEDVADGMITMVENNVSVPVNLGSGQKTTIREIALILTEIFNYDPNILTFDTSKPSGESIRLMDTTRAEQNGFKAKTNLKRGLLNTVNWYMKNKDLAENRYNIFNRSRDLVKDLDGIDISEGL